MCFIISYFLPFIFHIKLRRKTCTQVFQFSFLSAGGTHARLRVPGTVCRSIPMRKKTKNVSSRFSPKIQNRKNLACTCNAMLTVVLIGNGPLFLSSNTEKNIKFVQNDSPV